MVPTCSKICDVALLRTCGLTLLLSTRISEYFAMTQRLHTAFGVSIEKRQIDAAYVYGLRLASLAVELLPNHPEWKQSSCAKQKRRLANQVDQTLRQMEVLKQRMDAEELMRRQKQHQEEERQRQAEEQRHREEEERRQKQEAAQKRLKEERKRLLADHKKEQEALELKKMTEKQQSIEQSAMAKLQALRHKLPVPPAKSDSAVSTPSLLPTSVDTKEIQTPPSSTIKRQLTPRSSKEQATIDMLYQAMKNQEKRIQQIETKQIPQLLALAKEHLKKFRSEEDTLANKINEAKSNPHRRAALQCLARKKKLECQAETAKAAIFQMETQIFYLENAMEDRLVQQTLAEASQAMADLRKTVGVDTPVEDFAQDLATSLAIDTPMTVVDPEDEEDLLEELQELMSSGETQKSNTKTTSVSDEEASVLSLPPALTSLPDISKDTTATTSKTSSPTANGAVQNLLKAVMG